MPQVLRSKWFEELRASITAPITRETLDEYPGILAFDHLQGDERTDIEDLLLEQLARNDGRAADALARFGVTRAVPVLVAHLAPSIPGATRLAVLRSLHTLGVLATAGPDRDAALVATLDVLRGGDRFDRAVAADVLALLESGPDLETSLLAALDDPDEVVRSSIAKQIVAARGLDALNHSYRDRAGLLQNRLSSSLQSVRADALAELHNLSTRLSAGASPDELHLTWQADINSEPFAAFVASLGSTAPPWIEAFALDAILPITGYPRRWAEDCLWHFLLLDPRAARALASLGVTRALEPLREALPRASGETAAITAAIETLTSA